MKVSYINEFKLDSGFMKAYDEFNLVTESYDQLLDRRHHELDMFLFFNESVEDFHMFTESEEKGIFQIIGEKILEIMKAFREAFAKLLETITGVFKKSKSEEKDMKRVLEAHPELAESFLNGIKNGSIKYTDYKDIEDMIDSAEKIIKELESNKLESKSFIDKMNNLITSIDTKLKPIAGLLGTITAIATSAIAIIGLRNVIDGEIVKGNKLKNRLDSFEKATQGKLENEQSKLASPEEHLALTWKMKIISKATSSHLATTRIFAGIAEKILTITEKVAKKDSKITLASLSRDDIEKHIPRTLWTNATGQHTDDISLVHIKSTYDSFKKYEDLRDCGKIPDIARDIFGISKPRP